MKGGTPAPEIINQVRTASSLNYSLFNLQFSVFNSL